MAFQGERDPRTAAIIGAAMEVHSLLGPGFLEPVYQEALALEFSDRGIPYQREFSVPIFYKNRRLSHAYRGDFLCFEGIIVELKALSRIGGLEESQLLHYLKATGHTTGLILNFGAKSLEVRRLVTPSQVKSAESPESLD